jgi:hypothetical protein
VTSAHVDFFLFSPVVDSYSITHRQFFHILTKPNQINITAEMDSQLAATTAQNRIYVAATRIGEIIKVFPGTSMEGRLQLRKGLFAELVSSILIFYFI